MEMNFFTKKSPFLINVDKNYKNAKNKQKNTSSFFQKGHYTGYTQMSDTVSKVNKKFISHLTRAQRKPSAAATVQVSHALPAVRSLVLTVGLRGQFPRWRCSRKALSMCSVLRCPDL